MGRLRVLRVSGNRLQRLSARAFPHVRTLYADNNALLELTDARRLVRLENLSLRNQAGKGLYVHPFRIFVHFSLPSLRSFPSRVYAVFSRARMGCSPESLTYAWRELLTLFRTCAEGTHSRATHACNVRPLCPMCNPLTAVVAQEPDRPRCPRCEATLSLRYVEVYAVRPGLAV